MSFLGLLYHESYRLFGIIKDLLWGSEEPARADPVRRVHLHNTVVGRAIRVVMYGMSVEIGFDFDAGCDDVFFGYR